MLYCCKLTHCPAVSGRGLLEVPAHKETRLCQWASKPRVLKGRSIQLQPSARNQLQDWLHGTQWTSTRSTCHTRYVVHSKFIIIPFVLKKIYMAKGFINCRLLHELSAIYNNLSQFAVLLWWMLNMINIFGIFGVIIWYKRCCLRCSIWADNDT